LNVRIHRGASEIGGTCVELEAHGSRLVLDVGRPLSTPKGTVVSLPPVTGLAVGSTSIAGVVISHGHEDHWGLAGQIPAGVPLYMGSATQRILGEAAFWSRGLTVEAAGHLVHRQPIDVGPFRVTPFLNDHSAFDAYSLLVEAGGRRLFYSGDIRGHGRKARLFEELLQQPPPADVMLLEGTNIRAGASDGRPAGMPTEADVEAACAATFNAAPGMVFAISSAQNIDRLVTLYRAALRTNRDLVVDLYTAGVARATGNPNIPQPGPAWPRVRVYVPEWQRRRVVQTGAFERVQAVKPFRVFEEQLAAEPQRYVAAFDPTADRRLIGAGVLRGATVVWSLWPGYLSEARGQRLARFLADEGIPMTVHHTSGHASVADLQQLAAAIAPGRLVPIHSEAGHRYSEFFDGVDVQPDGVWWAA
jgi:ribonuclease J